VTYEGDSLANCPMAIWLIVKLAAAPFYVSVECISRVEAQA